MIGTVIGRLCWWSVSQASEQGTRISITAYRLFLFYCHQTELLPEPRCQDPPLRPHLQPWPFLLPYAPAGGDITHFLVRTQGGWCLPLNVKKNVAPCHKADSRNVNYIAGVIWCFFNLPSMGQVITIINLNWHLT